VRNAEYEEAAKLRDDDEQLRKQKEEMRGSGARRPRKSMALLDEEVIAEVNTHTMTGVPLTGGEGRGRSGCLSSR